MTILVTLEWIFIIAAAVVAIWSQVKQPGLLWISVLLLCIVEAIGRGHG